MVFLCVCECVSVNIVLPILKCQLNNRYIYIPGGFLVHFVGILSRGRFIFKTGNN